MAQICGLPSAGFLFGLLLIAAAVEGVTHILLEDIVGWQAPRDASPAQIADFERREPLVASSLAVLLGIAVCWIFGIGILHWLNLGIPNVSQEWARLLDFGFTGLIVGGGTRAVSALLKSAGLLPNWPFGSKPAATPASGRNEPIAPSQPISAPDPNAAVIARLVEVDGLPGIFWKTFLVPPDHNGVLYTGNAPAKVVPPGQHIIRWIGSREPALAALVDMTEFPLLATAHHLTSADGEPLDWTFRVRMRVTDALRFAARVLDTQPLIDRRTLANIVAADLSPAIQAAVNDYDAGTLFDNPRSLSQVIGCVSKPLDDSCADNGLTEAEITSIDFAPAVDEAQAIEKLETLQGESGKQEIEQQLKASPDVESAVKALEDKTGSPHLLTPEEEKQVKQELAKPGGQARGIAVLSQAIERRMNGLRQRIEDRIEQVLLHDRHQTKQDKFLQRNAALLAWATRLKLLAGILFSAITFVGIVAPGLVQDDSTIKIMAAGFGLLATVGAFIGSQWLDSEYSRRKEDFERGWLNRLSAERVLESDALLRARTANELTKMADCWREVRHHMVSDHLDRAVRLKEIEEKANRLRQELEGAETGGLVLMLGDRVSAKQAQRLMDLGTGLRRDAEKLTVQSATLDRMVQKSDWLAVDETISAANSALSNLRNCFANRAMILKGN
ncbi:MAG: SPFH domain-containing protein [Chloroflexi bacterium]|nr:SPFH domain-containing protein [Chloroflexota bacterium]